MALPEDYWASYEHEVGTLSSYFESVQTIAAYQATAGASFAWRGAADASWALHSSIVLRILNSGATFPTEPELRALERKIIAEAHEWRLDWHSSGGRLTALELLAVLRHYGVPTRMLDFTYSPLIALWFAVEKHDDNDGRVFAIDIRPRLVKRDDAAKPTPWWFDESTNAAHSWRTECWVWRPPPFESRIVRQDSCFLLGGVPSTVPIRNVKLGTGWRPLRTAEILECMSLPFQLISYDRAVSAARGERLPGRKPATNAFTLRIQNKSAIRRELEQALGLSHRSLFPDPPGFAEYGRSFSADLA